MYYSKIIYYDTANARGLSTVLFVSGCTHHCSKCFNKETWDFNYGKPLEKETINQIIKSLKNPFIKNFVISGGDPLHPQNIDYVLNLIESVRKEVKDINIIIYTGYTIEELQSYSQFERICKHIDYIIDGEFKEELTSPILDFRGSTNQRAFKFENGNYKDISSEYFRYRGD